jgi:hypothetical protein
MSRCSSMSFRIACMTKETSLHPQIALSSILPTFSVLAGGVRCWWKERQGGGERISHTMQYITQHPSSPCIVSEPIISYHHHITTSTPTPSVEPANQPKNSSILRQNSSKRLNQIACPIPPFASPFSLSSLRFAFSPFRLSCSFLNSSGSKSLSLALPA